MLKPKKRVIAVDDFEYRVVVKAVNELRTELKNNEKSSEEVDDLLMKIIDAPIQKVRNKPDRAGR